MRLDQFRQQLAAREKANSSPMTLEEVNRFLDNDGIKWRV